jgi:hypothetical protein
MSFTRSRWPRARRAAVAALVVGTLGTAATACSAGSSPGVASLPGSSAHARTTAAGGSGDSYDRDIVGYTHCLRAHGLSEPDPREETHNGKTGLSFVLPPSSAGDQGALSACNHFIAGLVAAKQAGAQRELASWLPSLVRYATCMRSHDIPMLDPGPQGQLNLGNVPGITSDFGRYSPQFRAADSTCRHLLPHGVRDDGSGQ